MGITPLEFKNLILKLDHKPIAFGANCGVGSSDLLRTIKSFINKDIKIIAKGNAGIPKFKGGKIVYDGSPEGLTPEVLTQIYGEEDWSATIEKVDDEDEDD